VRLPGLLSSDAIAKELTAAQVYLQHSREVGGWVEGFGVTLTEAGAAGLPLLASASGGLVDQIVEGENGHLFPAGDIDAQAALMLALARDPARRAAMGARARTLAARFDSDGQARKLEDEIIATLKAPA
jgi:glycosyltransferase involved in cell wall biosynthesis